MTRRQSTPRTPHRISSKKGNPKSKTPPRSPLRSAVGKKSASKQSRVIVDSAVSNRSRSQSPNKSRRTIRLKPGTKALREIRHLQKSTNTLIPKASFSRVVREIFQKFGHGDKRIQTLAMEALHEAAELYLTQIFQDSILCCYHARRVTLKPADMHLVRRLRGVSDIGNR